MGILEKRIRILAGAAVLCLLFSLFPAAVSAKEATDREGKDSRMVLTTQVKGQSDAVKNQKGEVRLSNGTVVAAEGENLPDGLLFVVETVEQTDTDLHEWILQSMEGLGTNLRIYDIYFVDNNGQRYEVTGKITVTISLDGGYRSPAVYYVSGEGSVTRMDSSVANDSISFATTHNSYYVLAEQEEEGTEPTPTPGEETEPTPTPGEETEPTTKPGTNGNNGGNGTGDTSGTGSTQGTGAKTGDETNLLLWLGILCSSAVILVIVNRKRQTSGN